VKGRRSTRRPRGGILAGVDPHRLAEERSIALHAAVAERLRADPTIRERARARVEGWLRLGAVHPIYARAWTELLSRPVAEICTALTDPGERARALRQCSPFAFVLDARTRWRIWRATAERGLR
jgi:hypothetical protein